MFWFGSREKSPKFLLKSVKLVHSTGSFSLARVPAALCAAELKNLSCASRKVAISSVVLALGRAGLALGSSKRASYAVLASSNSLSGGGNVHFMKGLFASSLVLLPVGSKLGFSSGISN